MEIVDKLREMTINLSGLLNKKQITYWADFGTLLGIVRERDIIAYDNDVDIGYFHKDRDALILTLTDNLRYYGYHIHIITGGRVRIFYRYDLPNEPYADFYSWSGTGQMSTLEPGLPKGLRPYRDDIGNLTKINCWEREIYVPEHYEKRLERLYGNWKEPVNRVPYWG